MLLRLQICTQTQTYRQRRFPFIHRSILEIRIYYVARLLLFACYVVGVVGGFGRWDCLPVCVTPSLRLTQLLSPVLYCLISLVLPFKYPIVSQALRQFLVTPSCISWPSLRPSSVWKFLWLKWEITSKKLTLCLSPIFKSWQEYTLTFSIWSLAVVVFSNTTFSNTTRNISYWLKTKRQRPTATRPVLFVTNRYKLAAQGRMFAVRLEGRRADVWKICFYYGLFERG